jgi:hypothetical protein
VTPKPFVIKWIEGKGEKRGKLFSIRLADVEHIGKKVHDVFEADFTAC